MTPDEESCANCGRGDLLMWMSPGQQRLGFCSWCQATSDYTPDITRHTGEQS
jgi:hypothetical protein